MLVSVPNKLVLLPAEHRPRLEAIFPKVGTYREHAVLPHTVDATIVLRNLGLDVPSPILTRYEWPIRRPFKPFKHQRTTAAFFTVNKRAFCLNDMGTGKTLSAYWAADFLMREGSVRKALVLSPLSTLNRVHGDTLHHNFVGDHQRTFAILHGTAKKRRKLFAHEFDFYVINHDALHTLTCKNKSGEYSLMRDDIDLIIIDELATYRNGNTERWKNVKRIIKPHMWVWGLTGGPTPNAPTDAYAQVKLVKPESLTGYGSMRSFRDAVMQQVSMFKWVPRPNAMAVVHRVMQPAIRYSRDECLDLPECTYTTLDVPLSDEQKKAYKALMDELVAEVQGGTVTAVNEGVKLMRLMQVVSGVVYDIQGNHRFLDCRPRLTTLVEEIEQAPAKVIVFAPFKGNLPMLEKAISKHWTCAAVNGATPPKVRDQVFDHFQRLRDPHVLVAHPECMAHGLTLTEAATIIWWAPTDSNEDYTQANDRINRTGQKLRTTIINLASAAVERRTYTRLERQQKLQGVLLDLVAESK